VVVAGRERIDPRSVRPDPPVIVDLLFEQLGQFGYDDKGKVTGKIGEDGQDDLGMAFIQLVFWRISIKAADRAVADN